MLPYREGLTLIVRRLHRNMTDAERLLWSKLRRRQLAGVCFCRQRIIGEYIVDFYCWEAALVLELDGGQHFHGEGKKKDAVRDSFLRKRGLRILRFDNRQVLRNSESVLEKILKVITGS